MDPALPTSWKTLPLPEQRESLGFQSTYTVEEAEVMALGLIPQKMEDKWFIYANGEYLYFYRSWTGANIFGVRFEETPEGYGVVESWANRDPEQYRGTIADDRALLAFLIDALLLGKSVSFPLPADRPSGNGEVYQHHVVGRANLEQPDPYKPPKEGEISSAKTKKLLPPISGKRLAAGLGLLILGALAWWAGRQGIFMMATLGTIFVSVAGIMVDPLVWKRPIKPRDHLVIVIGVIVSVVMACYFRGKTPAPWVTELMMHSATVVGIWVLLCSSLLVRWWKCRNNPPYQPGPQFSSHARKVGSTPEQW